MVGTEFSQLPSDSIPSSKDIAIVSPISPHDSYWQAIIEGKWPLLESNTQTLEQSTDTDTIPLPLETGYVPGDIYTFPNRLYGDNSNELHLHDTLENWRNIPSAFIDKQKKDKQNPNFIDITGIGFSADSVLIFGPDSKGVMDVSELQIYDEATKSSQILNFRDYVDTNRENVVQIISPETLNNSSREAVTLDTIGLGMFPASSEPVLYSQLPSSIKELFDQTYPGDYVYFPNKFGEMIQYNKERALGVHYNIIFLIKKDINNKPYVYDLIGVWNLYPTEGTRHQVG